MCTYDNQVQAHYGTLLTYKEDECSGQDAAEDGE